MKEILAIIPAREGSKGLRNKNIINVCGQPLMSFAIQSALRCKHITRVIVSTDSERIAEVAKEYGAEIPFMRLNALATDRSSLNDVTTYTLRRLEREELYSPYAAAVLLPTSPYRRPALIDMLCEKLLEGYASVQTVRRIRIDGFSHCTPQAEGMLSLNGDGAPGEFYRPYGTFSGFLIMPGVDQTKVYHHVLSEQNEYLDIDTEKDLALARCLLNSGMHAF